MRRQAHLTNGIEGSLVMQKLDNNHKAIGVLVKAGLWEKDFSLLSYGKINYNEIYRIAEEQSPFYSQSDRWSHKANKILLFILETGSFGHDKDYSYYEKYPYVLFNMISFWRHIKDTFNYFSIFPLDSLKVLWSRIIIGVKYFVNWK